MNNIINLFGETTTETTKEISKSQEIIDLNDLDDLVLENHTTIDLDDLDDLDTPITENPLIQDCYLSNDDIATLDKFKGIARAYDNKRVSTKYQHIDSVQLSKKVCDHLINKGYDVECRLKLGAGTKSTKHIIEIELLNMPLANGEGYGKILILNSYNGECSLTILSGFIRFCCANGIISGENESFERIIHIQGETVNDRLRRLTDKIDIACEYLKEKFGARVDSMVRVDTTYTREIEILLQLKVSDKVKLEVITLRHPANRKNLRVEDRDNNLWTFFNVVNEVIKETANSEVSEVEANLNLIDDILQLAA